MDPHGVLFLSVEVIHDKPQVNSYVSVKFILYLILSSKYKLIYLPGIVFLMKHHLDPNLL